MNFNFVQSCEVSMREVTRCLLICGTLPSGENVGVHVAKEFLNLRLPNLVEWTNTGEKKQCSCSFLSFLFFFFLFFVTLHFNFFIFWFCSVLTRKLLDCFTQTYCLSRQRPGLAKPPACTSACNCKVPFSCLNEASSTFSSWSVGSRQSLLCYLC